ncbi:DUF3796 domain-containing protein [Miniphocaeibacter halophilus]|uniref:DUF3796 domain-containing protein n=1 Tax=Miniphocaeibacter halophilus TaxID=2931922 RepID=A0AC61MX48_9FIRM|nr:DUF3796 domain-containing protein [Miniphocaeibacter halophilus]QQK08281.1 DUF3796 domain-containing protein [Miniphocaeibacter halophilus]
MKKIVEKYIKYMWVFGFFGLIGLIPKYNSSPNYFFFSFFAFFSIPLIRKIDMQKPDERLIENILKAKNILLGYLIFGLFLVLLLLDRNISKTIPLVVGIFIWVSMFFLYPLIFFKLDND